MLKRRDIIILILLFFLLFGLESFVTYRVLTSQAPGANDYFSRWYGARALLVEGRNPYGLDVTEEIQPVIQIDPSEVGRGGFNYPLHVVFIFWPLVYLSYPWAQAIWMVMLQWFIIGMVVALLGWQKWKPSPPELVALVLTILTFYVVVRSLFLGQFTLPVTFFLAACLWALQSERDVWAGVLLAATSIKPQMVVFVGVWFVIWAVGQRRWRFLAGLLGGGLAMLLGSMALYPVWPLAFYEDMGRYTRFAGGRNPLAMLLEMVWPGYPQGVFTAVSALLILAMLWVWWQTWRSREGAIERGLFWAIIVGIFITFQTGTTNQTLLLIPWFAWLVAASRRWGKLPVFSLFVLSSVGLWALFLGTISGDYENPILFLPLPLISLAMLLGQEVRLWRDGRETAVSQP